MTAPALDPRQKMTALRAEVRDLLEQVDRLFERGARQLDAATRPPASDPVGTATDPLADLPALISVEKAAGLLGLSRANAYRCAKNGDIPTRRLGGRVYVITARLRELLEPDLRQDADQ
ncbi:hypothetical protein FDG2_1906 [Candidatus Protofrankia californiensis]|uniref:Helix-turn-helix domain-containing protein n=1 Tax=Candidatus Protofrankia californiensis TaxID=1839754 RepID=A0A1C3NWK7_9ACTN|nr:hypothetical protein FDG2_1906 [Candidatus Protofrankia californiensis]